MIPFIVYIIIFTYSPVSLCTLQTGLKSKQTPIHAVTF